MTREGKWNLIVEKYQQLYSSLESKIQTEWEMYCSDLFGYRKLFDEIDAQRHLSVGSGNAIIPDIILCVDKKDIFVTMGSGGQSATSRQGPYRKVLKRSRLSCEDP